MKKLLVAVSACALLALAGCGDDGGSESEELSRSEFIEQADAICKESNERIEAAEDDFADPESPTQEEIETAVDDILIPELRSQLEDLRDLEPPAEDADEVDAINDALASAIEALEEDWKSALQNDVLAEPSELAADYGLEDCGS